jgi:HAD superfamily hydrolase (TIGR01509 family)
MNLWVFDNDGTLYDDLGAGEQFLKIFYGYFGELLNMSPDQVAGEVTRLKDKWNTEFSILALVKEHGSDFTDAVNNTYLKIDLEACKITAPDPLRLRVINALHGEKVVLTNNPSAFAKKVLSYIGLAGCFSDLIGMEETQFRGKPDPRSYQTVEDRHPGSRRIIFCDDSLKNLEEARKRGWTTVWCKPASMEASANQGHIVISSFEELTALD